MNYRDSLSAVAQTLGLVTHEHLVDGLLHRVHPSSLRIDVAGWLFQKVEVLLHENESVRRLLDQVFLIGTRLALFQVSDDLQPPPQVSLFDLVEALLVILVGELVDHSLPLLKQLGRT